MAPGHQAIWGSEETKIGENTPGCRTAALSGAILSYLTVGTCLSESGVGLAESVSAWEKIWRRQCRPWSPRQWKCRKTDSSSARDLKTRMFCEFKLQKDRWARERDGRQKLKGGWQWEGVQGPGVKRRLWSPSAPSCSCPPSTACWDQWANHGRSLVV